MKIKRYEPTLQPLWDQHVLHAKNGHFMHQRAYMEYHADRFHDHSLLLCDETDRVLAALPACEAQDTLHSHQGLTFGGLITTVDSRAASVLQMLEAIVSYATAQGFKRFSYKAMPHIYHQHPASEDEYALFRLGARLTRVDITTTVDYASPIHFSTLRKRGAKKAEKAGVTIRRSNDYASFHAIIRAIVEGKYETQATHSQSELELLAGRFSDAITLHGAYLGDEMLAGVLIFETASVAHAQYIGATPHGRELGALDMLFSQLIQQEYAAKRYFDFGISTEQAGRFLNEGLIAQKEGFGGRGVVHKFFELALT